MCRPAGPLAPWAWLHHRQVQEWILVFFFLYLALFRIVLWADINDTRREVHIIAVFRPCKIEVPFFYRSRHSFLLTIGYFWIFISIVPVQILRDYLFCVVSFSLRIVHHILTHGLSTAHFQVLPFGLGAVLYQLECISSCNRVRH